jgi:hypothetical protein
VPALAGTCAGGVYQLTFNDTPTVRGSLYTAAM